MLIRIGPDIDQLRTMLMQEALNAIEQTLASHHKLKGVLAQELVRPTLTQGTRSKWAKYEKKMTNTTDAALLHEIHNDFLRLISDGN